MARPDLCRFVPLVLAGCISTDIEQPAPDWLGLPCAEPVSPEAALGEVVFVFATLAEGPRPSQEPCSGVAVAPQAVLTSRECAEQLSGSTGDCDRSANWSYIDPSGEGTDPAPGQAFNVGGNIGISSGPIPNGEGAITVSQVEFLPATSYCKDDFALLLLESKLDVRGLPIRFGPTPLGEELRVGGYGGTFAPQERRELPAKVRRVVAGDGDIRTPPNALYLDSDACSYDRGGALFSPTTGALVGTIVTDPGSWCDKPNATTLAVNLSKYRAWLLDLAERRGIALRSEFNPTLAPNSQPPLCPAPDG